MSDQSSDSDSTLELPKKPHLQTPAPPPLDDVDTTVLYPLRRMNAMTTQEILDISQDRSMEGSSEPRPMNKTYDQQSPDTSAILGSKFLFLCENFVYIHNLLTHMMDACMFIQILVKV